MISLILFSNQWTIRKYCNKHKSILGLKRMLVTHFGDTKGTYKSSPSHYIGKSWCSLFGLYGPFTWRELFGLFGIRNLHWNWTVRTRRTPRTEQVERWKSEHRRWQLCWWHRYVGDFMKVTDFRCWWQNHDVCDFFRYVGDFLNVLNRSPTS